jgi:hypothetical protein
MKDVELVANLLLLLEASISGLAKDDLGEVRGYSQDELDEALSERDTEWEFRAQLPPNSMRSPKSSATL